MLLCDGCGKGFHMECLPEPLEILPETDEAWFCPPCLESPSEQRVPAHDPEFLIVAWQNLSKIDSEGNLRNTLVSTHLAF